MQLGRRGRLQCGEVTTPGTLCRALVNLYAYRSKLEYTFWILNMYLFSISEYQRCLSPMRRVLCPSRFTRADNSLDRLGTGIDNTVVSLASHPDNTLYNYFFSIWASLQQLPSRISP